MKKQEIKKVVIGFNEVPTLDSVVDYIDDKAQGGQGGDIKELERKVEANTIEINTLDQRTHALEDEVVELQEDKVITSFDYVPADSNKKIRKFYNGSIVGNQLFITLELYDNTVNTTTSGYIKHGTLPDKVIDNLGNEYEIVISSNTLNPCLIRLSTGVMTDTFINLISTDKSLNIFCTSAMNNAKFSNIIIQTTLTLKKVA